MPGPIEGLDRQRPEIERRILDQKQTHQQVCDWLATQGIQIAPRTLKTHCKKWGVSRRAAPATQELADEVRQRFRHTLDSDTTIASDLNSAGF